jgi:plastin-1
MNTFQKTENNNLVINSARAIGCSVVNIGASDLIEGNPHLILGLVWQIIKRGLMAKINLQFHPELFRLLNDQETIDDLLSLPADEILLRWINYQLKNSGKWDKSPISNFSGDLKDSEAYAVLMNTLCPVECDLGILSIRNLNERAIRVVSNAQKIGCNDYISEKAIIEGNPRLNLAFIATLFNKYPNLKKLSDGEKFQIDEGLFDTDGNREVRALVMGINSLNVEPYVNNLFRDLRDGSILSQVIQKISKHELNLKEFAKGKLNEKADRFISLERCNLAIKIANEQLNIKITGLHGADILDGNKTLILGLIWQIMRYHILSTLNGISDVEIINWVNGIVNDPNHKISSFKDQSLKNGKFLLYLLQKLKPGCVDPNLIEEGSEEAHRENAKYAISVARKLGATIFLLPEDIIEVRAKLIMTLMGTIMAIFKSKNF